MTANALPADLAADDVDATVFLRRDLLALGWNDRSIRRSLDAGTLVRIRHGSFVEGTSWRDLDRVGRHRLVARSVLARAGAAAALSHASALAMWRCPEWGLDLETVDLTRLDHRTGRVEAGVRQHRGTVAPGDVVDLSNALVMGPVRAVLEHSMASSVEAGLVQVNDLIRRGLIDGDALAARYAEGMSRWPGSLTTELVLRLADGRCESVAESRFLHLCWRAGLPRPGAQLELVDSAGHVWARLDFAWPELGAFVEVDGRAKYLVPLRAGESAADVVVREKVREDRIREETGWRCLRISWADLERPDATAHRLRRLLFPGGPTGQAAA